eukprot:1154868-Pelagomonas_calceolata.AAC.6
MPFLFIITPLDCLLITPQNRPLPARSRWPPLHSGHTLGSICRLGGAAGGSGGTESEFGWLSAQICKPSTQQRSPNGISSVLKICRWPGWQKAGYHTGMWRLTVRGLLGFAHATIGAVRVAHATIGACKASHKTKSTNIVPWTSGFLGAREHEVQASSTSTGHHTKHKELVLVPWASGKLGAREHEVQASSTSALNALELFRCLSDTKTVCDNGG